MTNPFSNAMAQLDKAAKIKNFGDLAESRQCASGGGLFISIIYNYTITIASKLIEISQ